MIKQGTRKSLRVAGTLLTSNSSLKNWDDSGNPINCVVAGDVLMLTGEKDGSRLEIVVFATGKKVWLWRDWFVKHTSLLFDARVLEQLQDA